MNSNHRIRRIDYSARHHGVALVAVIALFAVSVTLFGLWAKAAVRERQRIVSHQSRVQAQRLAEAGISRAMARRAADPQYNKETWSLPAKVLSGTHTAEVRIQVLPAQDGAAVRYQATAVFPVDAVQHVEITKRIDIPNPLPRDET
jgi:type II secretory pathway component PulK